MIIKNDKNGFKMPLHLKSIYNFTQRKNGSADVTDVNARSRTNKHHAQSGRSTWSALDIFNTLHIFTDKPIREQGIE